MPETFYDMIIDHSGCLHVSIHDRRADEFETALNQIFAHRIGYFCLRRNFLERLPFIMDRFSAGKSPYVFIETPEFILNFQECFGIRHCRIYLEFVTNDRWILQ